MTTARAARAATCLLSAILVTTWTGTAALAHGRTLPDSSHYRSTVTAVEPSVPGLVLAVTKAGESLTLTNHTGKTVVVIGYAGEAYLRITSTGVDENIASLSSSLNGTLIIEGLPQPQEQANQQRPQRRHVSDQHTFTWHDHRIHWMAQQRPPVVAADPHQPHKVFDWEVPLRVNGEPVTVNGELDWKGLPTLSTFVIALIALAAAVGVALAVAMAVALRKEHLATRVEHERVSVSD
jgi:hypothetical protein